MKKLLLQEEAMIPALFFNFKRALIPLMHDDTYEAMARVTAMVDANAYKSNDRANIVSSKRVAGVTGNDLRAKNLNDEDDDEMDVAALSKLKDASAEGAAEGKVMIEHSDAIVQGILNQQATCEPGGFCAPCYELA